MGKLEELKNDKTKLITLVVFALDVLILIIVLIILWTMPEPMTPGQDCGYMCLPCTTGSGVCCGCRTKILKEYLQKNFDEDYMGVTKEFYKIYDKRTSIIHEGYIGDVKPVAHMIGEKREPTDSKATLPVRKWYQGNNCLLLNGVSFHVGRMRVPASGYYHIYSMLDISYHFGKSSADVLTIPSENTALIHSMLRSNIADGSEELLLQAYHPYVFSKNYIFGRFDTILSSDVYLMAGDEVLVKVSNISQVNSPPKNIFGVFMI